MKGEGQDAQYGGSGVQESMLYSMTPLQRPMSETVQRVMLPSGGWWDLESRARWGQVQRWSNGQATVGDDGDSGRCDGDLVDRVLVSLTVGWSFDEPVTVDSAAGREAQDLIAVLHELSLHLERVWQGQSRRQTAERLFAGMAAGRLPAEFAECHVMAATGWSWDVLQGTPADVVQRMALYLAVREARDRGGTLDFGEETSEQ